MINIIKNKFNNRKTIITGKTFQLIMTKTLKTNLILFLLSILLTNSCSDEKSNIVEPSHFQYLNDEIDISFYTEGTSEVPSINWGGEEGIFELETSVSGISINSNNGVISWRKGIPLGKIEIKILAKNTSGSTSTIVTINHSFSGSYDGGYNLDSNSTILTSNNYNLTFFENKTLTVRDGTASGNGTWDFTTGNNLEISYTYTSGASNSATVDAELNFSSTITPSIEGVWTVLDPNSSGYLKVSLTN